MVQGRRHGNTGIGLVFSYVEIPAKDEIGLSLLCH